MTQRIFIGPYVRGPRPRPASLPPTIATNHWKSLVDFLTELAPDRMIIKSKTLFAIEVLLIGTSIGTGVVWLSATQGSWLSAMLWLDGSLAAILVAVNLGRTAKAKQFVRGVANGATPIRHWAQRIKNPCELGSSAESLALATPEDDETDIPAHLELEAVEPDSLRAGDILLVEAGQTIFADGTVLAGAAIIDESAVTGHSSRVVRGAYGPTAVMRDSQVVEGRILVQVVPRRGHPLDWIGGTKTVDQPNYPALK